MLIEMRTVHQRDKDRFSGIKPVLSIQPAHIGLKKRCKNITPARPLRVQALDGDLQECSEQQLPIVGTGVASPGPEGVIPASFSFCIHTEHGELVLAKQDAVELIPLVPLTVPTAMKMAISVFPGMGFSTSAPLDRIQNAKLQS